MIIDWIGGGLVIAANYLIGKQKRVGWLINIFAQIPLAYLNWKLRAWGLYIMQGFLLTMFIQNYRRWGHISSRENS